MKMQKGKLIIIISMSLLAVGAAVATLHHIKKNLSHTQHITTQTSNSQSNSSAKESSATSNNSSSISTQSAPKVSTVPPNVPTGNFVSNHKPSLSSSTLSQEVSVCNTTAGDSCTITFTNGGTVKSLGEKTTNSNGSTNWEWNVKSIGLTQGLWTIKAIVSNSNQTKTATDPSTLEVQQ